MQKIIWLSLLLILVLPLHSMGMGRPADHHSGPAAIMLAPAVDQACLPLLNQPGAVAPACAAAATPCATPASLPAIISSLVPLALGAIYTPTSDVLLLSDFPLALLRPPRLL